MKAIKITDNIEIVLKAVDNAERYDFGAQIFAYYMGWDVEFSERFKELILPYLGDKEKQERLSKIRSEAGKKGGRPRKTPETATPPIPQSPSPIVASVPVTPPPQKAQQPPEVLTLFPPDAIPVTMPKKKGKADLEDWEAFGEYYNSRVANTPGCAMKPITKMTDTRKTALNRRRKHYSLEDLKRAVDIAVAAPATNGRVWDWVCRFDDIFGFNPNHKGGDILQNLLEGVYDERPNYVQAAPGKFEQIEIVRQNALNNLKTILQNGTNDSNTTISPRYNRTGTINQLGGQGL